MIARRAVLGAGDVDGRGVEMNPFPAQAHQLANPQGMPERHEDQQSVPNRVSTLASGVHQLGNLGFRQILALPVIGVLGPSTTIRTVDVYFADRCKALFVLNHWLRRRKSTDPAHAAAAAAQGRARADPMADLPRQGSGGSLPHGATGGANGGAARAAMEEDGVPAGFACQSMSASLQKRPDCCAHAK
jgi:hypothetical protein